jgi:hypothetical protein
MKRIRFATAVALLALAATPVFASFHPGGELPQGSGLLAIVWSEIVHYVIHMGIAANALSVLPSNPAMTWAMLQDQSVCATATQLTAFLFGNGPLAALITFVVTIATLAILAYKVLSWLSRSTMLWYQRFGRQKFARA